MQKLLLQAWGFKFEELMVYLQQVWGDSFFFFHLGPFIDKKMCRQTIKWQERGTEEKAR